MTQVPDPSDFQRAQQEQLDAAIAQLNALLARQTAQETASGSSNKDTADDQA